ncbi:MAG: hypothetical protein DCC55_03140 [Chloroflexi bacterium]|nr:MAG: hypothetical protein DCC55_03140 [Chloroflexota bacterium]
MKLREHYLGGADPFEGDRRLWLKSLPAGARVTAAKITLTPVTGPSATEPFEETFVFSPSALTDGELLAADWGVTRTPSTASAVVEIDFHTRSTLAGVTGSGGVANLQIDMGGVYVGIADDGTMAPNRPPLPVNLSLPQQAPLPGLTTGKIRLSRGQGNTNNLNITAIAIRSVPANVSVRLGDLPPFWTQTGELATPQTSPDFAALLNAFLTTATAENGFYAVPVVVHSDTIARLDVTLVVDLVVEQRVLPDYLPTVSLPYGYSSLPGIDGSLLTIQARRRANIVAAGAAVQGTFEGSRVVFGKIGASETIASLVISPERTLAQPVKLAVETPATAIDLPLANTQPGIAGLHLAIQEDADGKPSGTVLTSAAVVVEKPVPGSSVWGSAALPAEFRFEQNKRYWLVLQSVAGNAYWDVQPHELAGPALQASADGGFSWRTASTASGIRPLAALFRLRFTPDRFTVPLELQIGNEPDARHVRFDRFAPLGRVEFNADFGRELDEYLHSTAAASPCDAGELLVNGAFDQPPHEDATRRIFGVDAATTEFCICSRDLSRGLDLSRERYLTLTLVFFQDSDGNPPDRAVTIDCAGANPAHTSRAEIIRAINQTAGRPIASEGCNLHCPPDEEDSLQLCTSGESEEDIRAIRLEPWRQTGLPQGWYQPLEAAGSVGRMKWPTAFENSVEPLSAEQVVAVLQASGSQPAILAQRVPVGPGCVYLLRFAFAAEGFHNDPDTGAVVLPEGVPVGIELPRWEVHWLDAQGQLVQQERQDLLASGGFQQEADGLTGRELRLAPPAGATQAELRFVQPIELRLALDDVSFQPTVERLANHTFQQWETDETTRLPTPGAWTRQSGWLELEQQQAERYLRLRGSGPEDAVLYQRTSVNAGEQYELRVIAWPIWGSTPPPGDQADDRPPSLRARLELRWLAGSSVTGAPILIPLDGRGFPTHTWAGNAPTGASAAEIRLIQPQGGDDLLVGLVSFVSANPVTVPLTFLAEAPGELTVADLVIVYDPPAPPQAPLLTAAPAQFQTRTLPAPSAPVALAAPAPRSPLAQRAVAEVSGVGENYAAILRSLPAPVTTIAELAALDVETEIAGIPRSRGLALKAAAETLMAIDFAAAPFAALANETLEDLLGASPAGLAARTGQEQARVEQFQRSLRTLRLLLDLEVFRTLRLVDLLQ